MIRYYAGDAEDLEGYTREELIEATVDSLEDIEEMYDEMLNEIYPEVVIGYASFDPSEIMKELSPVDYRVGLSDFYSEIDIPDED